MNTVKGKLEELSRELQRQNKLIQDESKRSAVEEASRREELSAKFQDAVGDIHTRLASQSDEHSKQLSEVRPASSLFHPPVCPPAGVVMQFDVQRWWG